MCTFFLYIYWFFFPIVSLYLSLHDKFVLQQLVNYILQSLLSLSNRTNDRLIEKRTLLHKNHPYTFWINVTEFTGIPMTWTTKSRTQCKITTKTRAKIGVSHSHTTMTDLIRIDRCFFQNGHNIPPFRRLIVVVVIEDDIEKRSYAVCSSFVFSFC